MVNIPDVDGFIEDENELNDEIIEEEEQKEQVEVTEDEFMISKN